MGLGSVRVRLTLLVVLVALVVVGVAATVGTRLVEESLVDDVLDDTADERLALLEDVVLLEEGFEAFLPGLEGLVPSVEGIVAAELDAVLVTLTELDALGVTDGLYDEAGVAPGDPLPVLSWFGPLVLVDVDAGTAQAIDSEAFDSAVVPQDTLDTLARAYLAPGLDDLLAGGLLDGFGPGFGPVDLGALAELADDADTDPADPDSVTVRYARADLGGSEVVLAADVSDVVRSVDRIQRLLWLGAPLLVVLAAGVTWLLTGRALRPVERITTQVAEISSGSLHERVPRPRTDDEIARLASTMNEMLDRLEADDKRLRRFVSDASHELRTPVAVLRSDAEVALRPDQEIDEDFARGVLAESVRLEGIVDDLLVLARGDEAGRGSAAAEVDLDDIVLAEAARRRAVPVDTGGVSAGRVWGTEAACTRVVAHLLDNAARHARSTVAVRLAPAHGAVELVVDDDGPGVPAAERERIFERFTRLEEARDRDRGGAGLGLAVVAETVGSLGGSVTVGDAPLGGARFTVVLPGGATSREEMSGRDFSPSDDLPHDHL